MMFDSLVSRGYTAVGFDNRNVAAASTDISGNGHAIEITALATATQRP